MALADPYEMPVLTKAEPADQATLAGPVTEVVLEFADEVDLVQVDLIAPDQTKIPLYRADGSDTDKKGVWFALTLPEPLTAPGTYLIDYAASKTFADGKASATSSYSAFIIADPNAK